MQPRDAFLKAAKERFYEAPPFSTVLTGMAEFASETATKIAERFPTFVHAAALPQDEVPVAAQDLARFIGNVEHICELVGWWHTHRDEFVSG